eukprot:CAMPEP_0185843734 /NCGR_PEP_ID=MMETSP1354-20130828/143_1 /TAXON_ID=708628 /ORGANISM="Erythrolobus madagascarensis, Strain CCMP3276" /LENGTH=160 /DNA_ID=CAMNT_0028543277 /DNA_START=163 /DNA_END=644 /DNA_ORIENTATION=+
MTDETFDNPLPLANSKAPVRGFFKKEAPSLDEEEDVSFLDSTAATAAGTAACALAWRFRGRGGGTFCNSSALGALQPQKVLLSVRPDLDSALSSNVLLDQAPLTPVLCEGHHEPLVLLLGPVFSPFRQHILLSFLLSLGHRNRSVRHDRSPPRDLDAHVL